MEFFTPSQDPAEGLGVLMLFRLIEESLPAFFRTGAPIRIARAPGRLDVFGGLGGERASFALALPTAEAACCAVQARDDDLLRLWSPCRDGLRTQMLSVRLGDLGLPAAPIGYDEARAFLTADPRDRWAGYLLGALLALAREHAVTPAHGAEVLLHSDVPERCGVASSTAVTLAALRAFAQLFEVALSHAEQAQLVQRVEREVLAGDGALAPVMTSLLARPAELLLLRGGAADLQQRVQVPSDLEFVALATGGGVAAVAGEAPSTCDRALRFGEVLGQEPSAANRHDLGELLFDAHAEYAACDRSDPAAELVVDFVRQRRDGGAGVYGAKASGRRGGAVVLLGDRNKVWYEALRAKKALAEATGHSAHVFRWSSPGADAFGSIELQPKANG